jgi:hypothetical protein
MADDPNNKGTVWEVAGLCFKTLTPDEALKYAQEFYASQDSGGADIPSLTLADVKPWVALSQGTNPERLRQFREIIEASTTVAVRWADLDRKTHGASPDKLVDIESERNKLRAARREIIARLQAWSW